VQSHADAYTQLVAVYRSMGGGWVDLADSVTHAAGSPPLDKRVTQQPLF
jgi:hypothetical protein